MKEKNTCKQYSTFDLQSETIKFLRFPLIVGVVMSHAKLSDINIGGISNIDGSTMCLFNYISYLISDILARIPQPMFFFFSGLLFFRNVSSFNRNIYLQKLSRRVHSLLIPYVVWNLLIVLLYLAVQLIVPELLSGHNKTVADYSATDWLWAFWDTSKINSQAFEGMPINYPLWFVRDLMVTVLFTPLLYLLIKKLKIVFLCVLGIMWLFNFSVGITGFSFAAFFFFSLGAYFTIYKRNFIDIITPLTTPIVIFYVAIAVTQLYFSTFGDDRIIYLQNAGRFVGMAAVFGITSRYVAKGARIENPTVNSCSFFLYAFHSMPLLFISHLLLKIVQPQGSLSALLVYFASPAITIAAGILLYSFVKRYVPHNVAKLFTGGR